ncbi:glycosyltransferase family 4 protein [Acinetobacter sp. AGC35]
MNKKVLVSSFELGCGYNRGIYYFTQALIRAIGVNHSVGVLTNSFKDDIANIYKSLENPRGFFYNEHDLYERWIYYFKYFFKNNFNGFYVENSISNNSYLDDIDFFINKPLFYFFLNQYLRFPGKNLKCLDFKSLDKNDIVFTSSPICIYSKKQKIIQTVHDVFPLQNKDYYQPTFSKKLFSVTKADKIMAISEYARHSLLSFYPHLEERVEVVYQAIAIHEDLMKVCEDPLLNKLIMHKFNLNKNKYMFFVGAIEFRKNIHNLIKAFEVATLKNQELKFVIAGRADDKSYLNKYDLLKYKLNLNEVQIKFIGEITDVEKVCLMQNCRAFLFPSLLEGFGIPVIEAQTLGVPVLTANNSALSEVAENSALVVNNAEDVEELVEGIQKLWEDDEYCTYLVNKGFDNIKRFSFEKFSNNLDCIIRSI